ncbi:ABC transporter substrate-binding protein [Rhodomicrobium sp.]|uniref:ABC transporter substrate-binding protein n=1 Tax=Rhodomicrobium sp. TaxID=2720632 RepID=UPI0039E2A28D
MANGGNGIQDGKRSGISRRKLLGGFGAAALAATGGVGVGKAFSQANVIAKPTKIRIAWTEVAACHSPAAFGLAKGFYAKHGLDAELFFQGASGQTLIHALATNKADVGLGLILDFLKPLEQGFDLKLFVGTHGGCQRLLASKASGVTTVEGLKGKTISVADLAGPAKLSFSVTLAKAGIDPETDVNWRAFPWNLVGEAVNKGEAHALAQFDPWAYTYRKEFDLIQLADTQTGIYQDRVCCVIGANVPYLKANRDAVRRLAEATVEVHEYAANHPEEVAQYYFDTFKPQISLADLTDDLDSMVYHNHPIGKELIQQVKDSLDDLKLIKVISGDADSVELANQFTDNILV